MKHHQRHTGPEGSAPAEAGYPEHPEIHLSAHREHDHLGRHDHADGDHIGHDGTASVAGHGSHEGHAKHAGHSVAMFRDKFWITLLLTIPTLIWGHMLPRVLGY